jgi:hypothetical protein
MEPPVDKVQRVDDADARGVHSFGFWLLTLTAVGLLCAGLFADVLFRSRNFVYRDAGHFYYPYFKLIAREWSEGRIPLWNPYENCGEPLLANPTASVLYPGKLLFLLPYPIAYKAYLLGHVILGWVFCYLAAGRFGAGRWGCAFAATAYAFSGFELFQIYNAVFLVGGAWLPLGLVAVDRLVRAPSLVWSVVLSVVLAMQMLGGDPQVAFITGLAAAPYALIYHLGRTGGVVFAAVLALGFAVQHARPATTRLWAAVANWEKIRSVDAAGRQALEAASEVRQEMGYAMLVVAATIAAAIVGWRFGCRLRDNSPLARSCRAFALAAVLALSLCAVQLLPTVQLIAHSDRRAPDAPHEPMAFSLFPARLLELVAPACFGRQFPVNTRWAPFQKIETGIWTPTLYLGLAPAIVGFLTVQLRRGDATRCFLSWLLVIMTWMAFGKFGGLLWLSPGRPRPSNDAPTTATGIVFGVSDGLWRVCEETVPGFRSFRYPSKTFVFSTLALALLSGIGLERLSEFNPARRRTILAIAASLLVAMLPGFAWIDGLEPAAPESRTSYGPLDVRGAGRNLAEALGHSSLVALALGIVFVANDRLARPRRQSFVAAALFLILCLDLGAANRWLMISDDQSAIDAKPSVLAAIEREEAKEPDVAPFRVHRTANYHPLHWVLRSDPDRDVRMARWERNTLQPKYGVAFDVEYTTTIGTMSIYDVQFFFAPFWVTLPPQLREAFTHQLPSIPDRLVYFPRQGYNLWNTKYFVLPKLMRPDDEDRGTYTFLSTATGVPCPVVTESPAIEDDFIVLKNPEVFPRAWVVHRAEFVAPIDDLSRRTRSDATEPLVYRAHDGGLPLWPGPRRQEYPLREQVQIEARDPSRLIEFVRDLRTRPSETVKVDHYKPDHVRLIAQLDEPGFVVLADTYYPGWSAQRQNGDAVPIVRANRAMRAMPLPAGTHTIDMRYRCVWFELGAAVSTVAWSVVAAAMLYWLAKTLAGKGRSQPLPANANERRT